MKIVCPCGWLIEDHGDCWPERLSADAAMYHYERHLKVGCPELTHRELDQEAAA